MDFESPEDAREWVHDHVEYVAALATSDDEYAPVARVVGAFIFGDGDPDPDDVDDAIDIAADYLNQSRANDSPDRLRNSLFGPPASVRSVTDADLTEFGAALATHYQRHEGEVK